LYECYAVSIMLTVYTRHTSKCPKEGQSNLASLPLLEVDHGYSSGAPRKYARLGEDKVLAPATIQKLEHIFKKQLSLSPNSTASSCCAM
jgi:hypothetical protein